MIQKQFVALAIGRRSIAAAVFNGTKLEFWQVRSLQANAESAGNAVTAFLNWIISAFEIESAVLEELPQELQTRNAFLSRLAENQMRDHGIPVFKASEEDLLDAYGEPPLRTRAELRRRAATMFPQLNNPPAQKELLDAAVLGLYYQTERLLSDY
jgi:hypothetical protein